MRRIDISVMVGIRADHCRHVGADHLVEVLAELVRRLAMVLDQLPVDPFDGIVILPGHERWWCR
ncbi:MAG TPA: hypothetical protein VFX16_11115 [Pseudonocardiaceae bacterium]|nr:hypothetical protein [Pseudonocardiaceae bacterium]